MRLWVCGLAALLWSCDGQDDDDGPDADGDADTDADTDSDTDADTDTDTDADVDVPGLDERPANPTCLAPERPVEVGPAKITRVYTSISFDRAMWMGMAPGDTTRWWVPTQEGILYRFDDDPLVATTETVLDLTDRVDSAGNEQGLLGIAFHPDFAANGELYVYYTAIDGGLVNKITRFTYDHVLGTIDKGTESLVLSIPDIAANHNGGTIAFGPDGYLYLGTGDGGNAGDPGDRAQDPEELLGKMLRIDVDGIDPYEIPADNPFAGGGGRPEIYALGLRNPFRFAFDPDNGDLWLGDVGQGTWEEINLIELGGNYGWNIREGFGCYNGGNCPSEGLLPPISVYPSNGSSVIAGEVYHGTAISGLQGTFLYNDYYSGDVFGLFWDPVTGEAVATVVAPVTAVNIVHYAAHPIDHEVYLVGHDNGVTRGIYKLEPDGAPPPVDTFPTTLSATGCFDATDPTIPQAGLIPYTVSHPFWSDGADKARWLAIPDGTTIEIGTDGDWEAPIGTVLIKEFSRDGIRLETRLFVRHDDGEWAGYAYAWREDQSDADLLYGGLTIDTASGPYAVPDRGACLQCHTTVAGGSLGLETAQFNTDFAYPTTGRTANQLVTLDHIGMLTGTLPEEPWLALTVLPAIGDQAYTTEERARAYLHVNCAMCHQPDGPSRTETDFLYTTEMENTGLCGEAQRGDLGIESGLIIDPGDPTGSVLPARMQRRDAYAMPPVGTVLIDDYAVGIFHSWIAGMATCP